MNFCSAPRDERQLQPPSLTTVSCPSSFSYYYCYCYPWRCFRCQEKVSRFAHGT
uniref:Uncharacterized protein n=1 Tax=Arundo donax TaxID=35708 RepID=A0A0A9KBI9_ARUDO